jgi:hypothetical protein
MSRAPIVIRGAACRKRNTASCTRKGEINVQWIEHWCRTATGFRVSTPAQRREISRLYDEASSPGCRRSITSSRVRGVSAAAASVRADVRPRLDAASPPPGTFLWACSIARRSPGLWQVLRLENGKLVCPELNTALTE